MLERLTRHIVTVWVKLPAVLENVKVIGLHGCPKYRIVIVWHTFARFELVIRRDFPQCDSCFGMIA
jgi:hypothetical protein